jgi:subtilisin family serine protease
MAQDIVIASVTLKSRSGRSVHQPKDIGKLSVATIDEFRPHAKDVDRTQDRLVAAGFDIVAQTEVGLSISGPRALFESEFGAPIRKRSLVLSEPRGGKRSLEFFATGQKLMSKRISDLVEVVQLAVPGVPFHNALPPTPSPNYYWLNVLTDVPALLNATALHGAGVNGSGVRISMIDTGFVTRVTERQPPETSTRVRVDHAVRTVRGVWLTSDPAHTGTNYFTGGSTTANQITLGRALPSGTTQVEVVYSCLHPHYTRVGYSIDDVRGVAGVDLETDEVGHGTAEAANVLAVAPGATFSFVKYSGPGINAPLAGFQAAVQRQNPRIITCSWGTVGRDPALHLEVANAVANGIVVIFAAGNGHTETTTVVPIAHPSVISVGGAYPIQGGGFRASNYASSYDSVIYSNPQRHCPDVVGLVGETPNAALIMLPTEPNNRMDRDGAVSAWPNGDNTGQTDGWCVVSGTSAAAPQVAGVVALLLQRYPNLTPAAVKNILQNSARDVTTGSSNSTLPDTARAGWDAATGFGLVDATAALDFLQAGRFNAYIRDGVEDNGREPSLADRLWTSPDIIVSTEPLADLTEIGSSVKHRLDLSDNAEDGQTNYIYLRVQNCGALTGSATAKVYVTDPGMFGNPASWTLIGQTSISNLAAGEFRVAGPIEWPDAQVPSRGHYCLISILDSENDPAPDLSAIHSVTDFDEMVRSRNNVAWKNIEVVDAFPGMTASFSFYVEAPVGTEHRPNLEIDLREFPADSMAIVRVLRRTLEGASMHALDVVGESTYYTTLHHQGGLGTLEGLAMRPGERMLVKVTYTLPTKIEDRDHVIRARMLLHGANLGGYTYVVRPSQATFIGNRKTLELHRRGCPWEQRMSAYNRIPFADLMRAHERGFDNCAVCLGGSKR